VHAHPFDISPLSRRIWEDKYRLKKPDGTPVDISVQDSWRRLAKTAAMVEKGSAKEISAYETTFFDAMSDFKFLPAGRILAGAGSGHDVTLFNCFVMGTIEDDLGSIFEHVREAAITMQKGGGIGHDFSTLRPNGAFVKSIGAYASGPVSFMNVWDAMCRTIMSAGTRRGAMMGTLRCDHPDIEAFIDAKSDPSNLRNFNVSVLVPDAFIKAVRGDSDWDLIFEGKVYRTVRARTLWDRMMRATYEYAEPGILFIDRVNARNNLNYCETIYATNPCGEQPLPPHGACLLGSINLARLIDTPFSAGAAIDTAALEEHVQTAVRFLDNVIDVSHYPLAAQKREAEAKRRIGIGVTGLADALIFCGLDYDSDAARALAGNWLSTIHDAAYMASAELAAERGAFSLYDADAFAASSNVERLSESVKSAIAMHGIRNGCLTSIAPTGTISLLAGNVSSGIEPLFALDYERRVLQPGGSTRQEVTVDYAAALFRKLKPDEPLPATFSTAANLSVDAHLKMQSVAQVHIDSSISKTINCPEDISFNEFEDIYLRAYDLGLKGCTTFRPNEVTGAVLTGSSEPQATYSDATAVEAPSSGPVSPMLPATRSSDVMIMTEPLERADVLAGQTYRLKWPSSAHAIYVTINDIDREGRRRPFEIFINTKNLDHQAWTVALTRMISAVFRRGGDVSFVVEELKAIFDPQGGQWLNGRYVPSLIAAIGDIIEQHLFQIGFLSEDDAGHIPQLNVPARNVAQGGDAIGADDAPMNRLSPPIATRGGGRQCPRCGLSRLQRQEGCWVCRECSYSQCG
jgi:ribonucleoside-diphosphate reductase alpha chain